MEIFPNKSAITIYIIDHEISGNIMRVSRFDKNSFVVPRIGKSNAPLTIRNKPIHGEHKYDIIP